MVAFGPFQLDPLSHRLSGPSGDAVLTPLASRFLQTLALSPGEVVTRGALVRDLWGDDWIAGDPGLNRIVSEARRALGDDARTPRVIQTVHRQGYRLIAGEVAPDFRRSSRPTVTVRVWLMALITFIILTGGFITVLSHIADIFRAAR
ncbi:MAG TPA: winged helix-turn-helix domain-containing protein [Brevundimonas sp.]|nr:winged helix-turn-helix domain-containing protein [Brevundimonas sp.]